MIDKKRRALLWAAPGMAATLLLGAGLRKLHAQDAARRDDQGLFGPAESGLNDLSGLTPRAQPAPPPPFVFTDAAGKTQSLADYRGKGLVLNFWATWCMPCVAELPSLDKLARQMRGSDIVVLALSSDRGGADTVRRFYATHNIQALPVMLDPGMAAAHTLGIRGIPTTLVIDPQGREVARYEGSADWGSAASVAKLRRMISPPAAPHIGAT